LPYGQAEQREANVPITAGVAAQKIELDSRVESKANTNRLPWLLTPTFSLASVPALSICCGFTSQNLPIGLQLGSRPFAEETVLRVAYAYEQATPWHTQKATPLGRVVRSV